MTWKPGSMQVLRGSEVPLPQRRQISVSVADSTYSWETVPVMKVLGDWLDERGTTLDLHDRREALILDPEGRTPLCILNLLEQPRGLRTRRYSAEVCKAVHVLRDDLRHLLQALVVELPILDVSRQRQGREVAHRHLRRLAMG